MPTAPAFLLLAATLAQTPGGNCAPTRRFDPGPESERNVCGQLALAAVAGVLGHPNAFDRVFEVLPQGQPKSLRDLQDAALKIGLHTAAIHWRNELHVSERSPCVIRLEPRSTASSGHFVVLLGISGGRVLLLDPPHQPGWVKLADLRKLWDGVALHVSNARPDLPVPVSARSQQWISAAAMATAFAGVLVLLFSTKARSRRAFLIDAKPRALVVRLLSPAAALMGVAVALYGFHGPSWLPGGDARQTIEVVPPNQDVSIDDAEPGRGKLSVELTYEIFNHGNVDAPVVSTQSSCGCARPILDGDAVPHRGSLVAHVRVDALEDKTRPFKVWIRLGSPFDETIELGGSVSTDVKGRW